MFHFHAESVSLLFLGRVSKARLPLQHVAAAGSRQEILEQKPQIRAILLVPETGY